MVAAKYANQYARMLLQKLVDGLGNDADANVKNLPETPVNVQLVAVGRCL
jgi:hypothetical protein